MELQQLVFLKSLLRTNRQVYFDHNATTKVSPEVQKAMNHVLKNHYGNPSSLYGVARKSFEVIDKARRSLAVSINAFPHEICFTGCATESNNAVLKSLSEQFFPAKRKIISTPIEHPSIMNTLSFLEKKGIVVEFCSIDKNGHVDLHKLDDLIDDNTFLVCCMLANNETGTIQDISSISSITRKHKVLLLSDCVQAFGKIPIDVHGWGVDYASFSAHKLYGPKGVGALYIKEGNPFIPLLHGGHQEQGLRAGTESIHNIAGFGTACDNIGKHLAQVEKIGLLKNKLTQALKAIKPDCVINSPEHNCLPNTLNITFPNVNNAGLMAMLDYYGIAVSAGSACSSSEDKPSYTLKAIGLSDKAARETIRISLGSETSSKDINYAVKVFKKHFAGTAEIVKMISASQLDEKIVFDRENFILDVRPEFNRKTCKGIPNSFYASFFNIEKYIPLLPRDKHIIVVCQEGYFSFIIAYYLVSKGFKYISSLQSGLSAWKAKLPELYEKYSGQNVTILNPSR